MASALEVYAGTFSAGGQIITNLRFAKDTDKLAGCREELSTMVNRLDVTSARFDMEISSEKSKLMTYSDDI